MGLFTNTKKSRLIKTFSTNFNTSEDPNCELEYDEEAEEIVDQSILQANLYHLAS
jgi:hypothetical protein